MIGVGELGGVFAHGLLKLGQPVLPITRQQSIASTLEACAPHELILVCVGETELTSVLSQIPTRLRSAVALVQNEIVPRDWEVHGYHDTSGVVVWFEKKAGRAVHLVLPSLAYGPKCELLANSLRVLDIPCQTLARAELPEALAQKNLYILVHNIAGLVHPGSVAALWREHADFAMALAHDVLAHQEARLGLELNRPRLLEHLARAVQADPDHGCAGRSAPVRLERALTQAKQLGLRLPTLERVATER